MFAIIEPVNANDNNDNSDNSTPKPEILRPKDRLGGSDKMLIVYTCKPCGTRNSQEISRIAYKEGIVVSTCSNCKSSHLIADNTGKLDMAEYGKKIDTYLESKGETVQRLVLTPEQLDENYLVDKNGKVELHNKIGGQPQADSRIIDWVYRKKQKRQLRGDGDNEGKNDDDSNGSDQQQGPALLP